ncbi:MAG: hypothetical protein DWQ44_06680 [Bacteroidetes bacterium]|nr:MAG: hypothetical protein DWQ33_03155 [Bacteroidota bacterium]REK00982.1 MAG: hypothetical protein DWQ39_10445 [Bacteroidota bacterium]REK34585.1 MAG: hypothetical protein DWQ44_06680 [Bacteroidota bacterium]REK51844.1 MAG: hypothetical protein DWQ48_00280 [Bacteroidota bacterium]
MKNLSPAEQLSVSSSYTKSKSKGFNFTAFCEKTEAARFGISPAILTVITCLSALAAASVAHHGVAALLLVGMPTAIFISTIIAVAPMRTIYIAGALAMLIDLAAIILH